MTSVRTHIVCLVFFASLIGGCKKENPEDHSPSVEKFILTVEVAAGVDGVPVTGAYEFFPGQLVNYGYRLLDDYSDLEVRIGDQAASEEGTFIMDGNKALKATAKQLVIWKFRTEKAVYYSTPAIGDDGTIYFGTGRGGTEPGTLYALDTKGNLKWTHSGDYSFFSPVIDSDGIIYVQDFGYNLTALYPSGAIKWKLSNSIFPYMVENVGQRCPAIGSDGTIYFLANGLYAITPSMEILWHVAGGQCKSSPVIGPDNTIYAVFRQDDIMAINADGTIKWESHFDNPWEMSYASPAVDDRGNVYFASEGFYEGTDHSALYALSQEDGRLLWKYPTERFVRASPVVGTDGTVYLATKATDLSRRAKLISISGEGKMNWEYVIDNVHATPDDIYSTPSLGADGIIYFGAETGYLYGINAGNGKLAWQCELKMSVNWSSPVILDDGTMYIGGFGGSDYEGYIRTLRTNCHGYVAYPWPRFRHDNKNTGRY